MRGSLCLKNGILYVGRHVVTAEIRPYDLDGHPLGPGFSFTGGRGRTASASGIDIDDDHRLWVADAAGERLRVFSVFGRELPAIDDPTARSREAAGRFESIVDVAAVGLESELELVIARGGRRPRALQRIHAASGRVRWLRADGDPQGAFDGLCGIAVRGEMTYACEAGAGRVQVFRGGEFHYLFRLSAGKRKNARFEPRAIAPLADGRMVIAQGGAESSALFVVEPGGRIDRVLAEHGESSGNVFQPTDVVVEDADGDHRTRVAVIDDDGDRVQVFTLDGACFGSFADLPHGGVESSDASDRTR